MRSFSLKSINQKRKTLKWSNLMLHYFIMSPPPLKVYILVSFRVHSLSGSLQILGSLQFPSSTGSLALYGFAHLTIYASLNALNQALHAWRALS